MYKTFTEQLDISRNICEKCAKIMQKSAYKVVIYVPYSAFRKFNRSTSSFIITIENYLIFEYKFSNINYAIITTNNIFLSIIG